MSENTIFSNDEEDKNYISLANLINLYFKWKWFLVFVFLYPLFSQ